MATIACGRLELRVARFILSTFSIRLQATLSSSCSRAQHTEADAASREKAPLSGIKVLDLSRILAGPFCTMTLGDMGAEVIKVEKPGSGDDARGFGPPWVGNESAYFLSVNRNKKSIAVDMKSKEGAQIVKELAVNCDVLVENYMPGKLSEYGLGYDQLHQLNPTLIYASLTGFGQTGPYTKRGGFDTIAQAIGGLLHITGPEDGEPCRAGLAVVDIATGLYTVGAITSALLHRQKTNTGQHIQCNLLSTQVALLTNIASSWLNCKVDAKRLGTAHPSIVPYQVFQTKGDGRYIMFGTGNNSQFKELCQKLELEHLTSDKRYGSGHDRVINRQTLIKTISDRIGEKSLGEWLTILEGASFPYGPINNIQEVFSDPQVLHNGSVQEMTHSTVGKIRVAGPAMLFSESPTVLQYPPPVLGQHTFEILQQQLHYDDSRIKELEQSKIIQQS